jgi:hypothetical protein
MSNYAVKVPFYTGDKEEDMLFLTEGDSKFHLRVKLFNSPQEARQAATVWGEQAVVVKLDDNYEISL